MWKYRCEKDNIRYQGYVSGISQQQDSGASENDNTDEGVADNIEEERQEELANLDSYWDKLRLEWEWDQENAEGYVWTINIDEVSVLDVMGITT